MITNLFDNKAQHLTAYFVFILSLVHYLTDLMSGMNDLGFSKD